MSTDSILQAMQLRAREAVLRNALWLTASEVVDLIKPSTTNPDATINEWKTKDEIFSVQQDGIEYFPGYALDAENNYRPLPVIKDLLQLFAETKSGWTTAAWLASSNSFLGAKCPQDFLKKNPELVLRAAHDERNGIQHG